jgi:hypothetical protein
MNLKTLAESYQQNSMAIEALKNDDGLVPASELEVVTSDGPVHFHLRRFPSATVFPILRIGRVVEMLIKDNALWQGSAIDVTAMPTIIGRVTVFGVPLKRAFHEARKRGLQKSLFVLRPEAFDPQMGFPADLLFYVASNPKDGPEISEMQVWEDVRGTEEVFYGHAILSSSSETVHHLDCATIHFSACQKKELFNQGRKVKGQSYRKHFRVDGSFPLQYALELMRAYFPVDELLNEAFEINPS